jgi:hypothetical protein
MSRHWSINTAIALLLIAAPLAAQRVSRDTTAMIITPIDTVASSLVPSRTSERAMFLAPSATNAPTDMRARVTNIALTRSALSSEGSRSPAMMIVGGAAIIVGAVIGGNGGTAIAVGGGVLGLLGLWNYLK